MTYYLLALALLSTMPLTSNSQESHHASNIVHGATTQSISNELLCTLLKAAIVPALLNKCCHIWVFQCIPQSITSDDNRNVTSCIVDALIWFPCDSRALHGMISQRTSDGQHTRHTPSCNESTSLLHSQDLRGFCSSVFLRQPARIFTVNSYGT